MFKENLTINTWIRHGFLGFLCFTLLWFFYNIWQQATVNNFNGIGVSNPSVKMDVSYFIDKTISLSIEQVMDKKHQFLSTQLNEIPYQNHDQVYWLALKIKASSSFNETLVIHVDNAMLNNFSAYVVSDFNLTSTSELNSSTENLFSDISRNLVEKNSVTALSFPHVKLADIQGKTLDVLLRIEPLGPPNVPIILYAESNFNEMTRIIEMLYGAFIGIILLMSVYNLVLYFAIRDKVYLVYIGYLLTAFIVSATVNGVGYFVFTEKTQVFLNGYALFFHYYLVIFLLLFTLYFLRYDQTKSYFYSAGIYAVVGILITSIISLFLGHDQQVELFFSLQPLFYLLSISLVLKRLSKDFYWARFYFISWIPFIIGCTIQPLMMLNYIDYSLLYRNAFIFAVLIEITFMAFALAERIRRVEQDRLMEVSFHPQTGLPRKIMVEYAISRLIASNRAFSVLVIKPEQIERVALYVTDEMKAVLFKRFYLTLSSLLQHNDAIVSVDEKQEKVCGLEGDRLVILLDHKKSTQDASVLVQSIQQIIEESYEIGSLNLPLSAVIGIANFPEHGQVAGKLLNHAQLAIEQAIHSQTKWAYYESEDELQTGYRFQLASDMKTDLELGNFELYHQPQIDLKTMRVCGSECLLRWNHSEKGFIPPDVFIPIAEDMGIINRLSEWVIKRAIEQHLQILDAGYRHHMISINISSQDIASNDFYDFVIDTLQQADLSTNKIALELTESSTIIKNQYAQAVIEQFHAIGITVSIDDFGTGNSSMAFLSNFPCQEIKIDRQFVENVCGNLKRRTITESTVKMAKALGLEVVAEGINSQLDEDTLRDFGCDIGQGFYYAEPMPIEEYLQWLKTEVNGRPPASLIGEYIPKEK